MDKQYKIDKGYLCPNLICFDLIEGGKVTGMYIVPNNGYAKKFMIGLLKRGEYEWAKKW